MVHDIPVSMDGVGGISQPHSFRRAVRICSAFVADQPGTFIYHSHDDEAMLEFGTVRCDYRQAVAAASEVERGE